MVYSKTNSLLSIKSVSKTYDNNVKALQNISLNIAPGIFGLLGPNGAGKSSLMRIIVGLQASDHGKVLFNGIDISESKEAYRQIIGYLPQDFGLYPKVTAINLLHHFASLKGIRNKKERKEIVENLLIQTNLWEKRNMLLGTFSGGMKQRFGLAQSLIGDPQLLVIDEPTSGLDPEERYRLLNLLAQISKNTVILLSTHIVQDVADICSRFAILNTGSLVMEGEPMPAIVTLKGKVWRKELDSQDRENTEHKNILSTRLVGGRPHINVLSEIQPDATFEAVEPSLEDLYFSKIKAND